MESCLQLRRLNCLTAAVPLLLWSAQENRAVVTATTWDMFQNSQKIDFEEGGNVHLVRAEDS